MVLLKKLKLHNIDIDHEFYLDLFGFIINILCCSLYNNMIYWNQEQKGNKKWLVIKSTMIYTIHLEAKNNQSLGGDDYKKEVLP